MAGVVLPTDPLPGKVLDALLRGNSIEAIKLLRTGTGLDLKQAKDAIDRHLRSRAAPAAGVPAAHSRPGPLAAAASQEGSRIEAIRRLREQTGLGLKEAKDTVDSSRPAAHAGSNQHAPGEVPRSSTGIWLAAVLAAAAVLVYFLFGRAA